MADRRLAVMLAVPLLVAGPGPSVLAQEAGPAGAAGAAAGTDCRPPPPAAVDRDGKNPQPTQAEVVQRLDQSGCAQGSVDASATTGRQVDELYEQLMRQTAPAEGAGGGQ